MAREDLHLNLAKIINSKIPGAKSPAAEGSGTGDTENPEGGTPILPAKGSVRIVISLISPPETVVLGTAVGSRANSSSARPLGAQTIPKNATAAITANPIFLLMAAK
jgi:hypothetical protein